jgi:hypothetical protein
VIKQLINRSAGGDLKAMQTLLRIMQEIERRHEATEPTEPTLDSGDEKVIEQLKARLQGLGSEPS